MNVTLKYIYISKSYLQVVLEKSILEGLYVFLNMEKYKCHTHIIIVSDRHYK